MCRFKSLGLALVAVLATGIMTTGAASASQKTVRLHFATGEGDMPGPLIPDGARLFQVLDLKWGEYLLGGSIPVSADEGKTVSLTGGTMSENPNEGQRELEEQDIDFTTGGVGAVYVKSSDKVTLAMAVAAGYPLRIHVAQEPAGYCVYEIKALVANIPTFGLEDLSSVAGSATAKLYKKGHASVPGCASSMTVPYQYSLSEVNERFPGEGEPAYVELVS